MLQLSKRLLTVASMVTEKSRLADVGTDHGYIPIFLCGQGKIPSAIAMDIRKGPLARAEENIRFYGLSDRIETRLSDGVEKLQPGEADSVVIAGMGGSLVQKILEEGKQRLCSVRELILQPQSDICQVRRYLQENGWRITSEKMVCEEGKYYPMMHVVHGYMEPLSDIEWKYGQFLLKEKNPVLLAFLQKEESELLKVTENLRAAGSGKALERLTQLRELLAQNRSAQRAMH